MKNHKELFEALLKGETLFCGNCKLYLDNKGDLYAETDSVKPIHMSRVSLDFPLNWQIKPKTININGFEVPEPCREPLKYETRYWIPIITADGDLSIYNYTYKGTDIDINWLTRGLIHLTKEAALIHSKALLSFTKRDPLD